ncbi:MAG: hypothetical protein CBC16_11005 [Verrucomicrobia bacterium TMED56]|jgi:hypothetical protein|nr:MAG: hypothetical protein CBC16_11005 [Verrucomicrobia bacterium TMED56]|tara:strand:+ start:491 stop:955 length:465 start_codon:yes stop_codon:yes gene_type:complete
MKPVRLILYLGLVSLCPFHWAYSSKESIDSSGRFEKFSNSMKGVRFTGFFTIDDSDRPPTEETYEIHSVRKFGNEDLWIFTARIKYGKKDVTLPMPLPVKWVGSIPVITMQNLNIPGLGTFSAHVVIDGDKYAGTWAHGQVGGHLYGKISKIAE